MKAFLKELIYIFVLTDWTTQSPINDKCATLFSCQSRSFRSKFKIYRNKLYWTEGRLILKFNLFALCCTLYTFNILYSPSPVKYSSLLTTTTNIYLLRMIMINRDLDVFASHVDCRIAKMCNFVLEV